MHLSRNHHESVTAKGVSPTNSAPRAMAARAVHAYSELIMRVTGELANRFQAYSLDSEQGGTIRMNFVHASNVCHARSFFVIDATVTTSRLIRSDYPAVLA